MRRQNTTLPNHRSYCVRLTSGLKQPFSNRLFEAGVSHVGGTTWPTFLCLIISASGAFIGPKLCETIPSLASAPTLSCSLP